ncbi:MAG: capsule biosynthesis protein [Alphaproteobacteria bacterium]|nr:capsule biosynthesis protein [Alphaproteobacteria bacterium]
MWSQILQGEEEGRWRAALEAVATDAPRVLVATSVGSWQHGLAVESLVAVALTLRGARVEFSLCDAALPACIAIKYGGVPPATLLAGEHPPRCPHCFGPGAAALQETGLRVNRLSDGLSPDDMATADALSETVPYEDIPHFRLDGARVGEHALAGALRYTAKGDLSDEPEAERILRRYFRAAIRTVIGMDRLIADRGIDTVLVNHGIYVPQGLVREAAARRGTRIVTWNPSYKKQTLIFSHDDSYHHTMIREDPGVWEDVVLDEQRSAVLDEYLESRRRGSHDWIWFNKEVTDDNAARLTSLGVDGSRPIVTLLSSVVWDAQLHYESNAFPSMVDWLRYTVAYFATRPNLQLVVRIHPAEVTGTNPSRQKLGDELAQYFPTLPENVVMIPPESDLSTYALLDRSNAVLIYNTKMGIESSARGLPTIVAGEAWIRDKGFSLDAVTPLGYRRLLDRLPFGGRMTSSDLQRARRYAYHFFFRRMIPVELLDVGDKGRFQFGFDSLAPLMPGATPGLDVICRGLLDRRPFVYDGPDRMAERTEGPGFVAA